MNNELSWNDQKNFVYVAMSADIIHHGHINILNEASKLGIVVIGLMTDESITSYKRKPINTYKHRKLVVEGLKHVSHVIPQISIDYRPNVELLKASWVVHGTDWKEGPQSKSRDGVIELLKKWGGSLYEPEYTIGISTTDIINKCYNYISDKNKSGNFRNL